MKQHNGVRVGSPQSQTYPEFLHMASDFLAIVTRLKPASGAVAKGPDNRNDQKLSINSSQEAIPYLAYLGATFSSFLFYK